MKSQTFLFKTKILQATQQNTPQLILIELARWISGMDTWFSVHLAPKGIYNCDREVSEGDAFGMY